MMSRCSDALDALRALGSGQTLPAELVEHVADCEICARQAAQALLDLQPAAVDEDEAVLVAAGLGSPRQSERMRRVRRADPTLESDWVSIQAASARPGQMDGVASWRSSGARWAAAAGLLFAVGAALATALFAADQDMPAGLVPRGEPPAARYEVAIGEPMRYCQPDRACRWRARHEPLVVHYRGQAAPVRIAIRDAHGDDSQLFPDMPSSHRMPSEHPCPADRWCVVDGGEYDAPTGPARLCVEVASDFGGTRHCFDLEVTD